jgi:type VI secretion system secreted protein VgrG
MPVEQFALESAALPTGLRAVAFTAVEAISKPYRFEVFAVISQNDDEIDPDAVLGATGRFDVLDADGTPRRRYHGVFAAVELLHDLGDQLLYRFDLVPRFAMLGLSRHSRVFADTSLYDVFERVLRGHDLRIGDDVTLSVPARGVFEHLTQYRESDLDFLHRVMERAGIYYYFRQDAEREVMVVVHQKAQQPLCNPEVVTYFPALERDGGAREALSTFRMRAAAVASGVRMREYDPQRPSADVGGTSGDVNGRFGGVDSFGEVRPTAIDGRTLAARRHEELQSGSKLFMGHGRVFHLDVAFIFTLEQHARLDGRYQVLELRHRGSAFGAAKTARERLGFEADETYRVDVVAIPVSQQFRPARVTPIPRIYGVEEAVVCGPQTSPYAQIDQHGRYKVKVLFDEGDAHNGKASTWIRMLQPHGGNPEGMHLPLRKGTEVLLVFLGGDPDRPVIAGVAHNAQNPSVVNEDNHTQNVIHTGGNNRLEMEDLDGQQYVDLSTPSAATHLHMGATHGSHTHNWVLSTTGTGLLHTGSHHDVTVDGELREVVKQHVRETYRATQHTTVSEDVREDYRANHTTTVDRDRSVRVKGNHIEHVDGHRDETIDGDVETTVQGSETTTVYGASKTTVHGNTTVENKGTYKQNITGPATINAPSGYKINAPVNWFKITAYAGEASGLKIGTLGMKAEVCGLVLAANGIKGEVNGVKLDATAIKVDRYKVKVDNGTVTVVKKKAEVKKVVAEVKKVNISVTQ